MNKAYLWGGGGAACEVFHIISDLNRVTPTYEVVGVVGDQPPEHPILKSLVFIDITQKDWRNKIDRSGSAFITSGHTHLRELMYTEVKELGLLLPVLRHPTAVVAPDADIAEGCILGPNTTISSLVRFKPNVYLNFNSSVGHHTLVGEHSFFSPGTRMGARIDCGSKVFTGMNAVVLTGGKIGCGARVSACSLVVSPVPDGATVIHPKSRIIKFER